MNKEYYDIIFKRKSFHIFRNVGSERISEEELRGIYDAYESFERLYPDIRTGIRVVSAKEVKAVRGAEYCILIYSEKKENYLMNAGYIGEQLDLYLVRNNIGSLWYGIGKPDMPVYSGMDYVIMIAVHKISDEALYRKDMFRTKRKKLSETWKGDTFGAAEIARFAPSACNSQPWRVVNGDGAVSVFRQRKQGRIGLLSKKAAFYFNRIDMGIYLCILEICLSERDVQVKRELFPDEEDRERVEVARYTVTD